MTSSVEKSERQKPRIICDYKAKLNGGEFVGLKFENGTLRINFPLGYKESKDEKERRKDILNLISVLSTFSDRRDSFYNKENFRNNELIEFPIHAYLFIVNNFLSNGYYIEREPIYKKSANGKISWSRTIKQIRPQIADGNVVYLDFIVRKTSHNDANLITLVHKYCVHESFTKIGFLFSSFVPQKSELKFNSNLFKAIIQKKMSESFNEKDLLLFKNMLDMINYIDHSGQSKTFYYGTEKFDHVWESLVDSVFGEPDKEKFYPKCRWVLRDENGRERQIEYNNDIYKKYTLRPDTIMIPARGTAAQKIFVLDSKFYKYGVSNVSYDLPGSDSIIKQFAYAEFIEKGGPTIPKDALDNLDKDEIYNAFILPFDKEDGDDFKYFGYAKCDSYTGKKFHKIYGILLDVKSIMRRHIPRDKELIDQLAKRILSSVK